ncbi:hypothetical protein SAMN05216383_13311 [Prevotella sp. KH2C16]|nr:hypothetical protein SAMN05216383_13311 [Prevotella sp. KH2C16]
MFCSILYVASILLFVFLLVFGSIAEMLRDRQGNINGLVFVAYFAVILLYVAIRYLKKGRVLHILECFQRNKYDELMPTWLLFMILPVSMVIGIGGFALLSVFIIQPYGLKGFLCNILCL